MGKKRTRKSKGEAETNALSNGRWSGLNRQQQLVLLKYTAEQNAADREACRRLVNEGYGSDAEYVSWMELWGQK